MGSAFGGVADATWLKPILPNACRITQQLRSWGTNQARLSGENRHRAAHRLRAWLRQTNVEFQ